MCGIFAFVATGASRVFDAGARIMHGLRRLEYRGYDSWGVAMISDGVIYRHRQVGSVGGLNADSYPRAALGIGHTRWATHGGVCEANAHPHFSSSADFALVHNGIVENYQALQQRLINAGHRFDTDTDTEVIVRLIEHKLQLFYARTRLQRTPLEQPLRSAVAEAFCELQGLNTILVIAGEDEALIAVRNGSPLVVGYGGDAVYIASDPLSFSDQTCEVSFVDDMQLVEYRAGRVCFHDILSGERIMPDATRLNFADTTVELGGQPHYMLKEILEQPQAIAGAARLSDAELKAFVKLFKTQTQVFVTGAGGAYFAAGQIAYYLRSIAGIDAQSIAAYEFEADASRLRPGDVFIAVSQSGETIDTIDALQLARQGGARIASVVNMPGATISRLSEFAFYSNAGPELCVLSTKSSAAQMTFGYLLARTLLGEYEQGKTQLRILQERLLTYLTPALINRARAVAQKIFHNQHLFTLGKDTFRTSARIGALNIKEASYIHAEAFAAGELKHGVIALVESGVPVIVFVPETQPEAMLNAAAEVKSRGAYVIGIARDDNALFDAHLPLFVMDDPCRYIASLIPCQLLAYYLSTLNGHNPDRPRNLAKSVTVR